MSEEAQGVAVAEGLREMLAQPLLWVIFAAILVGLISITPNPRH